jgi:hypothetical protein
MLELSAQPLVVDRNRVPELRAVVHIFKRSGGPIGYGLDVAGLRGCRRIKIFGQVLPPQAGRCPTDAVGKGGWRFAHDQTLAKHKRQ